MRLKYWHNSGYDTVTLHDDGGDIVGSWTVTGEVAQEFVNARHSLPDSWEPNWDDWRPEGGMDELLATIDASGVCQHGETFPQRLAFFGVCDTFLTSA